MWPSLRNFGISYIVLLPKGDSIRGSEFKVDDFRSISICSIISKLFEKYIWQRFKVYVSSSGCQFGFKSGLSCSHAIYSVRKVVDHYVDGGSTVNMCTIDLSKAFDKINHSALFLKLIKRKIPIHFLRIIKYWFTNSFTCDRWGS